MFWNIGSADSYARGRQLETKWNLKKESGDFTAGIDPLTGNLTGKINQADQEQETAQRIESLRSKLKAGKRLSVKEKAFLREKAPALYKKAVEIEQEREEYRRALRRCKTKEDVLRLNGSKMGQILSAAKAAKGDMDAMETAEMRAAAIQDEHVAFVSSKNYKLLPSEAERRKNKKRHKRASSDGQDRAVHFMDKQKEKGLPEELKDRLFALADRRKEGESGEASDVNAKADYNPADTAQESRPQAAESEKKRTPGHRLEGVRTPGHRLEDVRTPGHGIGNERTPADGMEHEYTPTDGAADIHASSDGIAAATYDRFGQKGAPSSVGGESSQCSKRA